LSPRQAIVIPVAPPFDAYAMKVCTFHCDFLWVVTSCWNHCYV